MIFISIGDVVKGQENPLQEVVPNIIYGQGHNVRKGTSHRENFENPYARKLPTYPQMQGPVRYPQSDPQGYPQYPQGYPQYPMQQNYGRKKRKKRKKRDAPEKTQKNNYDPHSGIHRIMSTG